MYVIPFGDCLVRSSLHEASFLKALLLSFVEVLRDTVAVVAVVGAVGADIIVGADADADAVASGDSIVVLALL